MSSENVDRQNNDNRIVGPVIPAGSNETQQPRQPTNMQDLLRYAVEAGSADPSSSNFEPLTDEKRKFLEEVLSSMTLDVIKEITEAMTTLSLVNNPEAEKNPDIVSSYEAALTTITELVDNIDIANDFQKLNGFKLMNDCLFSKFNVVRWRAAEVIALCTQNNFICQKEAVKQEMIPKLMHMAEVDNDMQCRIKAFYAVSCIIRECEDGLNLFIDLDGFSFLMRTLQSKNETLRTKSSFLVSSLSSQNPGIKETLIKMGYIEQLVGLIQGEHSRAHEHLVSTLLSLITDSESAILECRRPELQLHSCLLKILKEQQNDEACMEEIDYIRQILQKAFSGETEGER